MPLPEWSAVRHTEFILWSSDTLGEWLLLILVLGLSDLPHGFYGAKCNFIDVFAIMIPILYQVQLKGFNLLT